MAVLILVAIVVVLVLLVTVLLLPAQKQREASNSDINSSNDRSLIEYCKKVNIQYERLFQTNDFRFLTPYISRALYVHLYNTVAYCRAWVGIPDQFREVNWSVVKRQGMKVIVRKVVIFTRVNTSANVKLALCTDFSELWLVDISNKSKPIIERIDEINAFG